MISAPLSSSSLSFAFFAISVVAIIVCASDSIFSTFDSKGIFALVSTIILIGSFPLPSSKRVFKKGLS